MQLEPVWVSTVEHIGKHAAISMQMRRRYEEWNRQQLKLGPVWILRRRPSSAYELPVRFPYCERRGFPPVPIVFFGNGQLTVADELIDFRPKPIVLSGERIFGLYRFTFNLAVTRVMAVTRFKSPFPFNRSYNINWVHLVTDEVISTPLVARRSILRVGAQRLRTLLGLSSQAEKGQPASLIGKDFLLCVGDTRDMSRVHQQTEALYYALLREHRHAHPELAESS